MNEEFRSRLSFKGSTPSLQQRENWQEALQLLPKPDTTKPTSSLLADLPNILEDHPQDNHIEWVLTKDSQANRVRLVPYSINVSSAYPIPSFNHLFSQLSLNAHDMAWVEFFTKYLSHDDNGVVLDKNDIIHAVLWRLACSKRLRLAYDNMPLTIADPLELKARLRYSEEWVLWALDAELIMQNGEVIEPEALDFIAHCGLVIYQGKLFYLPKGAVWVTQILANGAWFIAEESLGNALYHLSIQISDGDFLRHIDKITCIQKKPLPVVYLKARQFDQQTPVALYLAFRYEDCEVFSRWHSQEAANIPIKFEQTTDTCNLYFRNFDYETNTETLINQEEGNLFIANKNAWFMRVSSLWKSIPHLLGLGWEIWAEKQKIEPLTTFGLHLESGIGWFELQPLDTNTRQRIDPLQLIKYLKRKSLFVQLGDGKICVLPERWITHLTKFSNISQPDTDNGWHFSAIYATEIEETLRDEAYFESDDAFCATVNRIRSFGQVEQLTQPDGLRTLLRPYQLEGLSWLNLLCELHIGGILADDMGLGKTVQILALLQHRIVNQPEISPQIVLVICPKSVQNHWLTQIHHVTPRLSAKILGSKDMIEGISSTTSHQILLGSYNLIRHHIEILSTWKFDLIILDEAQMIKNTTSQTTQAIKKLHSAQRFALSGTPIENHFEELVSIFSFLNPHAQLSLGTAPATPEAIRDIVERALHPFVLRRLKTDVLPDLPSKTINEILLPMAHDQARLYQELQEIYRHEIVKHKNDEHLPTEAEAAFFLEGLMRLRQVATHPQQLLSEQFQACTSNKLIYLCEHLPLLIEKGHRIVIFSQFLGFLRSLSEKMQQLEIRHSYVDGATIEREREIALFQSNTSIRVLLISLKVGGVGIDLTNTDLCIIADPWWNEAVENQAIDRLHRFGQKKNVTVLRLISENSIEEKMEILKKNKSELAKAIGKTKPDFLNQLKWNDFTEIF